MMDEMSNVFKNARLEKGLSINKVSEDTKIRLNILKDIEEGNYSSVPEVYMKSFIKTLSNYYKININETENLKEAKSKANIPSEISSTQKETPKQTPKTNEDNIYTKPKDPAIAELAARYKKSNFEKPKKIKKVNTISLSNYVIYGLLFVAIIAAIVIIVIALIYDKDEKKDIIANPSNNDTVRIETKKNNILTYFQNGDSLSLKAVAKDTAWLRLIIDNNKYVQEIMRPGDSKEWFAYEQFVIDVGNSGAITFYRNGQQLPMFGKPGTVAKNIKITKDNVISIPSLQPADTSNIIQKPKVRKKKENELKNPPPIIESNIQEEDNLLKKRKAI